MASFPDAPKSFAARSNGQTIDASHVGDLQDEVNAIEDGYLSGTARLNSSHSTVATLSVTGGSTFAVRPTMPPLPAVRVSMASTVTLAGSSVAIPWDTQEYVTNSSLHSLVTNSSRFTPDSTGVWEVRAQVAFSAPGSSGNVQIAIRDSSQTAIAQVNYRTETGQNWQFQASATKRFDVLGGYLVVFAQLPGSTGSLLTGNTWAEFLKR